MRTVVAGRGPIMAVAAAGSWEQVGTEAVGTPLAPRLVAATALAVTQVGMGVNSIVYDVTAQPSAMTPLQNGGGGREHYYAADDSYSGGGGGYSGRHGAPENSNLGSNLGASGLRPQHGPNFTALGEVRTVPCNK